MSEQQTVREQVRFESGADECAGWFYPGGDGSCVIMTGGLGVTVGPGTDRFAARFQAAGHGVLAFDYRRLGGSGGRPRQVVRVREQLADWDAALAFAPTLPGVEADRLAVWAFSLSGGHVFRVAARHPELAAAIAQSPFADGVAATRNALRFQAPGAMARLVGRGLLDAAGGLVGRPPLLVPLDGERGTVALLTTPDAVGGARVLDPDGAHPDWQPAVAARTALWSGNYRPGRAVGAVRCPLLVVVCDDDRSVLAAPAVRAAAAAPDSEVRHVPGGHYAPFLDAHEAVVAVELDFLARHLGGASAS